MEGHMSKGQTPNSHGGRGRNVESHAREGGEASFGKAACSMLMMLKTNINKQYVHTTDTCYRFQNKRGCMQFAIRKGHLYRLRETA